MNLTLALTLVLLIPALLLSLPITMLFVECMAALLPQVIPRAIATSPQAAEQATTKDLDDRPRVAVLIPAHNESLGIASTLSTLKPQLNCQFNGQVHGQVHGPDRLIVIADNCTDQTAAISRAEGAEVIERHNPQQRGKGFALHYGRQFLQTAPPDVVVVIDADCRVAPDTIAAATSLAHHSQRPVQVTNLLYPPAQASLKAKISSFAFQVHTFVRPNGLARLGLPFNLHGTGMVFPWALFSRLPLASDNIVEDMQLSLDMALMGDFPLFCAAGQVTGTLPEQGSAATGQRTRWEHGHLKTLLSQSPRLLKAAIRQRQPKLLALALDLCIPPLSLLVLLWLLCTLGAIAWACWPGARGITPWLPFWLLGAEGNLLLVAILSVWHRFGRAQLPLSTLLAVPFYVMWKIPIYLAFLLRPQQSWVRTSRES